jgi:hypothetical protein
MTDQHIEAQRQKLRSREASKRSPKQQDWGLRGLWSSGISLCKDNDCQYTDYYLQLLFTFILRLSDAPWNGRVMTVPGKRVLG